MSLPAVMKPEHSPLGASSYYRWKACPGSINLSQGIEKQESIYAAEGTKAHEIAAKLLKGNAVTELIEPDDMEAIATYVDYVNSLRANKTDKEVWCKIEHRFDLTEYYPELYGTADAVVYSYALQKLVVIDYKHGQGIPVEVVDAPGPNGEPGKPNSQLMYYGLGAMHELQHLPIRSVELVIVQPRCFHKDGPIRKTAVSPQSLLEFLGDLITDAKATTLPGAPLSVGDWCRFCPAAASVCPAIREKSLELAKEHFSQTSPYSPSKLGEVLSMLPTMEAWIKGVRQFAYEEAQAGRIPPGWKVVAKRANRKWLENWTAERIAQELGLKPPEVFEQKLRSPAQIEKLIPKHLHAAMELIVVQESSGNTLVPDSDSRKSVGGGVHDVFTVIEQ
jgi:uncharacterized protein DUF2800